MEVLMRSAFKYQCIHGAVFLVLISSAFTAVRAQTPSSQGTDKPWTATTESHTPSTNPTRTTESHSKLGNRTVDKQSLERLGSDGHYEPYLDVEKETVRVNATTVRTIERSFGRGPSGEKTLMQVTEEETQTLANGDSKMVRTTSNPDLNGSLQVVQKVVENTNKTSPDSQESKTTIFNPDGSGGLVASQQVEERQKRSGKNVEVQKSTMLPDGSGNWQLVQRTQQTTKEDSKDRTTEEQILKPDSDGRLSVVSRTTSKETQAASGEKRSTSEMYSTDTPGLAPDGSLHLSQRVSTVERAGANGTKTMQQEVEQPNPGDPASGLQVTTKTVDVITPSGSGTQESRTLQVRDASGNLGVVSVDTKKSDKVHAVQIDIAPQQKPK
jgi:hypothetical protein